MITLSFTEDDCSFCENLLSVLSKEKNIKVIQELTIKENTAQQISSITDELLSDLKIPFCKGRHLLKVSIISAYAKPSY